MKIIHMVSQQVVSNSFKWRNKAHWHQFTGDLSVWSFWQFLQQFSTLMPHYWKAIASFLMEFILQISFALCTSQKKNNQ